MRTEKGRPYPLGATWEGDGTNFALFAENATGADLCLFSGPHELKEFARVRLKDQTNGVWHVFLPEVRPGQLYAYRVYGRYDPASGKRFNASKLLLDPYAKAINGDFSWHPSLSGYARGQKKEDLVRDFQNSAPYVPKCVVVDDAFDWQGVEPPRTPMQDTIFYETHVKGISKLCPHIPPELRGTYAGLGSEPVINYLRSLGVTAVELLPVHHHVDEEFLYYKGLTNYWGYASIGFFAPHAGFAAWGTQGSQVHEFKTMVRSLHAAGIEVILDVVYNHTGEGNHLGPTLSFRGIDNEAYYRLMENRRFYRDFTGTGNTLDMTHPRVLQLVMDSLRYWVRDMGVDGFRFDLACALGRERYAFTGRHAFFQAVAQDPVLAGVKMIAEPWDLGEGGYQVGAFPAPWSEWNGRYRDDVRCYWKGDDSQVGKFASRIAGSGDIYWPGKRPPTSSVNFITAHDGFTLRDLVSYNNKHNEANQEGNRDGDSHNNSWNHGAEGPTEDAKINDLRARQQRNFLATLFVSQGVPMLSAGDEFGRSQGGNNNAYCQDNEISWLPWEGVDEQLLEFTRTMIALRREHPIFRRTRFFQPEAPTPDKPREIVWFSPEGKEMTQAQWYAHYYRCLTMTLHGRTEEGPHTSTQPPEDVTFLVLFNAHSEPVEFLLPGRGSEVKWELLVSTALPTGQPPAPELHGAAAKMLMRERSMAIFTLHSGEEIDAIQPCPRPVTPPKVPVAHPPEKTDDVCE
jgi:isoamylase